MGRVARGGNLNERNKFKRADPPLPRRGFSVYDRCYHDNEHYQFASGLLAFSLSLSLCSTTISPVYLSRLIDCFRPRKLVAEAGILANSEFTLQPRIIFSHRDHVRFNVCVTSDNIHSFDTIVSYNVMLVTLKAAKRRNFLRWRTFGRKLQYSLSFNYSDSY